MPRSDSPRKKRGTPKYVRDLDDIFRGSQRTAEAASLPPAARTGTPQAIRPLPKRNYGRWGAGAAVGVGLGALAVHHRNRRNNWKGTKMDVRKNADIPFKGVRTFAAPKPSRHKDQLPFTEHFHNSGASPRQLTVTRSTGTKGNRRGQLVVVKKSALPTRVTSVQPRTPQGKFVGHANDVQVFHPKFKSKNRQPRTSTLQHYTRSSKDQYAAGFAKADTKERVSGQRRAMASVGGLWHPVFAGKKGEKASSFGSSLGHAAAGGVAGNLVAAGLTRGKGGTTGGRVARLGGRAVGVHGGLQYAVGSSQRKGRLKTDYRNSGPQGTGVAKDLFGGGLENSLALTGSIDMRAFGANQGRRGQRFDKDVVSKWAGHQQGKTLAGTFGRGGQMGPGAKQQKVGVNLMPQKKDRVKGFSLKPRSPFRRETVNNSTFDPAGGNFISAPNTSRWARNRGRHAA